MRKTTKSIRSIENMHAHNQCRQQANKETIEKYIDTRKHHENVPDTNAREHDNTCRCITEPGWNGPSMIRQYTRWTRDRNCG